MSETKVTLREWVYESGDSGGFEEVEYPYRPIKAFVEWLMNTAQWKEDPKGEIVYNRWLVLKRDLTDARNAKADAKAEAEKILEMTRASLSEPEIHYGKPIADQVNELFHEEAGVGAALGAAATLTEQELKDAGLKVIEPLEEEEDVVPWYTANVDTED